MSRVFGYALILPTTKDMGGHNHTIVFGKFSQSTQPSLEKTSGVKVSNEQLKTFCERLHRIHEKQHLLLSFEHAHKVLLSIVISLSGGCFV
mmetsp:Transcript_7995/g.18035  ORF Transcript_7995/g.18035 Transcript_7995/m.18035 type:complete len:91 (+) Transcript_7995:42-314(+)